MARIICYECKNPVGGFGNPIGFICPACGKLYCIGCSQKHKETYGLNQKSFCPNCGR